VTALADSLDVQILRVFTDRAGDYGNELAVVYDAADLPAELGLRLTVHLGFAESVFIDDEAVAGYRIFTPNTELRLAGHPTVGTAWVLGERAGGAVPEFLRPRLAAPVAAWREARREQAGVGDGVGDSSDEVVWIRAAVDDAPPWQFVRLDDPAEVDALPVEAAEQRENHQFWAWTDEAAGTIRARTFAAHVGVPEDEATGSAAIRLVDALQRPVTVRQGRGSVLYARPAAEAGWAEIGGRVVSDGWRRVTV
jgi:predicted PhzF superfamily epimerase YddE/YHI9